MERPSWDDYFFDMTELVSRRATCSRLHAGCVIVSAHNHILASGYNGAPAGMRHCDHSPIDALHGNMASGDMTDGHCNRAQHAERNAIAQAAKYGVALDGCTAYTTGTPCLDCARMMISSGIRTVKFRHTYGNASMEAAQALLWEANVYNYFVPCRPEVCGYEYCPQKVSAVSPPR